MSENTAEEAAKVYNLACTFVISIACMLPNSHQISSYMSCSDVYMAFKVNIFSIIKFSVLILILLCTAAVNFITQRYVKSIHSKLGKSVVNYCYGVV